MESKIELPTESQLYRRLLNGEFAITAEVTPPVAGGAQDLLDKALPLKGHVDAVNVTDGASARVHMSSLASSAILIAGGIEPVTQFTCRDRNRIALMGDLLGAAALGVHNILLLHGDDPTAGDQPMATPVFDLTSMELIDVAATMTRDGVLPSYGVKMTGGGVEPTSLPIKSPPRFFVGAADLPSAKADTKWRARLRQKVAAGAQFIQTQLCYDMDVIAQYAAILEDQGFTENLFFLIGNGPLASAKSAIWMRDNLFGVIIPDDIIDRLAGAKDAKAEGIKICVEQLQEMAAISGIAGAHLMAPINTASIPEAIATAKIGNRS